MKLMSRLKMLKPTRWKLVVALVPFIFPFAQMVAYLDIQFGIIPVELDLLAGVIFLLLIIETSVARPFAFLLEPTKVFWSHGYNGPFSDGPLLPGSFAVAIIYSLLIYLIWSLVSFRLGRNNKG